AGSSESECRFHLSSGVSGWSTNLPKMRTFNHRPLIHRAGGELHFSLMHLLIFDNWSKSKPAACCIAMDFNFSELHLILVDIIFKCPQQQLCMLCRHHES